ncbi:type B DNA-directed DNA polymerase [Halorubellus sp. PRR65]|uniref:type B DNA-directed DNA polymerase n=1 Tax=Halorubellus sp. PRR65 TaxID=3098148 RepID=UPI002B25C371|nr:type B DNA-directed DNA polymerase [Halorubellus sp. PRR65]
MAFVTDFRDDGRVRAWTLDADGGASAVTRPYAPRFYVGARGRRDGQGRLRDGADDRGRFVDLRAHYEAHPDVLGTSFVHKRTSFGRPPERLLAVDATHVDRVRSLARQAHEVEPTGDFACYDVDLSPGFRYHLDALGEGGGRVAGGAGSSRRVRNDDGEFATSPTAPTPARDPETFTVAVPEGERGNDAYEALVVDSVASSTRRADGTTSGGSADGDRVSGDPPAVAAAVDSRVAAADPDVLVLDTAKLVPRLAAASEKPASEYALGREPGYRELAGESTYTSYGAVGHSPARYAVPGRAIVDLSNTFFVNETSVAGVLDLVARSHKPLQEAAWASIGNVLTAIQIREARERGVVVPWHAWRHEAFASLRSLHDADRGGLTLSPAVGRHRDVHELDFSSLYPNVICTRNVSPDTVRCACHRHREDVPGLGYAVCDADGYLPDVLRPIVDDRDDYKAAIAAERASDDPDPERIRELEGRSSALKWILVSCFGYQGFSNAKFGRIECHEAINAYAREILLSAKERLEAGGWRVLHGIVDSIWVTPAPDVDDAAREPLDALASEITDDVGIRLEHEARYDWVAFCPLAEKEGGALTKYVAKRADAPDEVLAGDTGAFGDSFKLRGVAARRRNTPEFVADVQRECLRVLDATDDPRAVAERAREAVDRLRRGDVDPDRLVARRRTGKPADAYQRYTDATAALDRARDRGVPAGPGRDVAYVVVDADKTTRARVRLASEPVDRYDADHYATRIVRAVADVLGPLDWSRGDVRDAIRGHRDASVQGFSED